MQNGALQDYPLDEDDLENFYMRNLSRFVVVRESDRERERERERE